jgi:hypothetical protein
MAAVISRRISGCIPASALAGTHPASASNGGSGVPDADDPSRNATAPLPAGQCYRPSDLR